MDGTQYPRLGKDGDFEAGLAGSQARLLAESSEPPGLGLDLCLQGDPGSHSQTVPPPQGGRICVLILGAYGTHPGEFRSVCVWVSGLLNADAGTGFVPPPLTMHVTPPDTGWVQQI